MAFRFRMTKVGPPATANNAQVRRAAMRLVHGCSKNKGAPEDAPMVALIGTPNLLQEICKFLLRNLGPKSLVQISLPIATAVSAMRFEKPHSLSYQVRMRHSVPSITLVWSMWKIEEWLSWLKSDETLGWSV